MFCTSPDENHNIISGDSKGWKQDLALNLTGYIWTSTVCVGMATDALSDFVPRETAIITRPITCCYSDFQQSRKLNPLSYLINNVCVRVCEQRACLGTAQMFPDVCFGTDPKKCHIMILIPFSKYYNSDPKLLFLKIVNHMEITTSAKISRTWLFYHIVQPYSIHKAPQCLPTYIIPSHFSFVFEEQKSCLSNHEKDAKQVVCFV